MARSWTFGKKIAAGFALSFVLLAAIGAIAYRSIRSESNRPSPVGKGAVTNGSFVDIWKEDRGWLRAVVRTPGGDRRDSVSKHQRTFANQLLGGAYARCPGAPRQRAQPAEGCRDRTARLHHHRR